MKTEAGRFPGIRRGRWRWWNCRCATLPIELKPERFAESRQRALGGVGFCGLKRDVVNLTG